MMRALAALVREAKADLEFARDQLQAAQQLAKVNVAVRALAAVDELIYTLEDGERARARAEFRKGPPETGPGPGPPKAPGP